jgi:hypothetical protein
MRRLIKKARIPCERDFYDNPWDYDFIDIGIQDVLVNEIVGMSSGRNEEYNEDWTPIDKNDSRWEYQKNLVENGGELEPIPLIKLPENISINSYIGNGDGSHRISVAKVLKLKTIPAYVTIMILKENGINTSWEQFARDDINKLNELNNQYKELQKGFNKIQDDAWETGDKTEYNKLIKEMNELGSEISNLDHILTEKEKEYKKKLINY